MIVREFGVRQGRKALAAHLRQGPRCLRSLTTETSGKPVASADPALEAAIHTPDSPKVPSLFMKTARAPRRRAAVADTTKIDWEVAQQQRRNLRPIGAVIDHQYSPSDVWRNPPGPKDVTLELLMASQAHMGHHASIWNPANSRYIYGVREGIHIISLEETAAHLRRAARVVEEIAYHGGLILFVGTRPGHTQIVTQAARLAKACHLFTKWTPGTITNSDKLMGGLPIDVVDEFDNRVDGFEQHLADRRALIPDLVVCLNPQENFTLLHECAHANVPSIGVIDTNTEPTWVTYAIPANDDSLRCLAVIGSVLGRAGEQGQKRRAEAAANGHVTWETPSEIKQYLKITAQRRMWTERAAREEADKAQPAAKKPAMRVLDDDMPDDEILAELRADMAEIGESEVKSNLRNASRGKRD